MNVKKVLKILLLLFVLLKPIKVQAESSVYYTEWSNFSDWSEEKVIPSELVNVQSIIKWKWYKEQINYTNDYYYNGKNPKEYPYRLDDDFIWGEFSSWQKKEILKNEFNEIDTRNVYKYRNMKKVRYIYITDVRGSYNALRIPEINIYVNNKKINYSVSCTKCNPEFKDFINNNNAEENMSFLENDGTILIDLKAFYNIDEIKIKIYLYDKGTATKKYTLNFLDSNSLDSGIYAQIKGNYQFMSNYYSEYSFTHEVKAENLVNPKWELWKESLEKVTSSLIREVKIEKEYRVREKMFKYYNIEKIYLDTYENDVLAPYIKDETTKKVFYRFRTRDKIEVKNEIKIYWGDKFNIYDYVKSTNPKNSIKIKEEVDTKKIGIQPISILIDKLKINLTLKVLPKEVNVPNMIGWKKEEVQSWAFQNMVNPKFQIIESIEPKDTVIDVNKKKLNTGETFEVLLSKGNFTIPNIYEWSKEEINTWAKKQGINVKYKIVESLEEKNKVLSYDKKVLNKNDVLEVIISSGKIKIPKFEKYSDLEKWLQNKNVKTQLLYKYSEKVPKGKIINIFPSEIRKNDTLTVTVSLGENNLLKNTSKKSTEKETLKESNIQNEKNNNSQHLLIKLSLFFGVIIIGGYIYGRKI